MRDLVMAYYFVLRQALGSRPGLRACQTRCRHCRIFFLSHPRNRRRQDLGCPFGCRDAHHRKASAERSAEYYRTATGKAKKALLNGKRRRTKDPLHESAAAITENDAGSSSELNAGIVNHVRIVTSLIEGFEVSRDAVIAMLEKTVRQRRIAREKRHDYELRCLAEHLP